MKSDIKALNIKLDEISERLEILESDLFQRHDRKFDKLYKKLDKLNDKQTTNIL